MSPPEYWGRAVLKKYVFRGCAPPEHVPQKYVPIEWFAVTVSVSPRIVSFPWGSCLSKIERVKANSIELLKIIDNYPTPAV